MYPRVSWCFFCIGNTTEKLTVREPEEAGQGACTR